MSGPEQKERGWFHKRAGRDGRTHGRAGNYRSRIKRELRRLRRRLAKRDPEAPTKKLTRGWE